MAPGDWALEDNKELDCALRKIVLSRSIQALGTSATADDQLRIERGLNMRICDKILGASGGEARPSLPPLNERPDSAAVALPPGVYADAARGSDTSGKGTPEAPFATAGRALAALRAGATPKAVWLRGGTFFEQVNLTSADSGVTIASAPGERAVLSGGASLGKLAWKPANKLPNGVFKAELQQPLPRGFSTFSGLFRDGRRLTRSRFPNCADITGTSCYLLNASGPAGQKQPQAPTHDLKNEPGAMNLEVKNQDGVDMFADASDNAPAYGPHGASDGTVNGNMTITVEHPDYAWRCHEDCGWQAYSKWRGVVADSPAPFTRMDASFNEPYWDQQVSGAFHFNGTDGTWTPRQWADPRTGVVHMYHSARWGGWIFPLFSRDDSDHRLTFACATLNATGGKAPDGSPTFAVANPRTECPLDGTPAIVLGGWQEARGGDIGPRYTDQRFNNSYFVENIFEETDYPDEWFFAPDEGPHGTLYLVPSSAADAAANFSSSAGAQIELVATLHARVVQVLGSAESPVHGVTVANVTVAHAAATFLNRYEEPSGGDWAITRNGAVFVDGGVGVGVEGCTLDQVDGNGVFLSRHVRNSTVRDCRFWSIGETAVLVVGASGRHRTNQANAADHPAFNLITGNLADTVGVWNKQSAGYFKSVTRANVVKNNVFYNGPRSGINFNDGAMGGEVLEGNVLFNFVRESNDHGPFNSWDRQPYIYRLDEFASGADSPLAISPQTQLIHKNLVVNFNFLNLGVACGSIAIDHDDESSQYNVTSNVLLYGGVKCFDGMDRFVSNNLVVYPFASPVAGPECFHALSSTRNRSSEHTHFVNNHCVLRPADYPYNCGAGPAPFYNKSYHVEVDYNLFSFPNATAEPSWTGACRCYPAPKTGTPPCPFHTFSDWQAHGHDVHSRIGLSLSNAQILDEATRLLN